MNFKKGNECPRCGEEMKGGICCNCGFPVTARVNLIDVVRKSQNIGN